MVRISAMSDPKKNYLIEVDIAKDRNNPFFGTHMENQERQNKFFKLDG